MSARTKLSTGHKGQAAVGAAQKPSCASTFAPASGYSPATILPVGMRTRGPVESANLNSTTDFDRIERQV